MYIKAVERAEERWTMRELRNDARGFQTFDYACYETVVTFQKSNRTSVKVTEGKKSISDKH